MILHFFCYLVSGTIAKALCHQLVSYILQKSKTILLFLMITHLVFCGSRCIPFPCFQELTNISQLSEVYDCHSSNQIMKTVIKKIEICVM